MDWSDVDYFWIIVMFLSAVWTLVLAAPIHCGGAIGSLSMELKAWLAEGGLGSPSDRAPVPSPWTLPLLWNWKLHK